MSIGEKIIIYLTLVITYFFSIKSYALYNSNTKYKIKNIYVLIHILFFGVLGLVNYLYNMSIFRAIFSLILWYLMNNIIYKEHYKISFYKTMLTYSIYLFIEVFLSIIIFSLNISNIKEYFSNIHIVTLLSIIVILITFITIKFIMLILKNKKRSITKIDDKTLNLCAIVSLIIFVLLNYKNVLSFNINNTIINIIMFLILSGIGIYVIKQSQKISEAHTKNLVFLDFLKTYEKQADIDSEFRHEIFNYMLIMKSLTNKKEADKVIDELLIKYNKKKYNKFKNISTLPNGIKGIIYYKVFELEGLKANVELTISNKINEYFKKKFVSKYKDAAEVLTILLDNCIDSVKSTKTKDVIIDIFVKDEVLNIEISNTITKNVNLKKIENKGYSTKLKHNGIGLYIARNIVLENKNFDLQYKIENQRFYSIFSIKK